MDKLFHGVILLLFKYFKQKFKKCLRFAVPTKGVFEEGGEDGVSIGDLKKGKNFDFYLNAFLLARLFFMQSLDNASKGG